MTWLICFNNFVVWSNMRQIRWPYRDSFSSFHDCKEQLLFISPSTSRQNYIIGFVVFMLVAAPEQRHHSSSSTHFNEFKSLLARPSFNRLAVNLANIYVHHLKQNVGCLDCYLGTNYHIMFPLLFSPSFLFHF